MKVRQATALLLTFVTLVCAQDLQTIASQSIPLSIPAGVPLRLYLTRRVPKRLDAPVEASLLTPVYAFDRVVIPSGTRVFGHVSHLEPVPKWQRIRAVLGGDFTPLHIAEVEFTSLTTPQGLEMPLHTVASPGLNSFVPVRPPKQRRSSPNTHAQGAFAKGKQMAKDQINGQIESLRSLTDLVRGPNKMDQLNELLLSKLPYHPQYVRNRTRFDAELREPLSFGSAPVTRESMAQLGSQPPPGSIGHARLLTPLDSGLSAQGQAVQAILAEPLFSADHKLLLPEATRIEGVVVVVKKARYFHRAGRLRFNFQNVDLPPQIADLRFPEPSSPAPVPVKADKTLHFRSQGTLVAAESVQAPFKVDSEGDVRATDSKTRFLGTAAALLITRSAADNDSGRRAASGNGNGNSNVSGRTLGGGLGFGLLGSIAAQSSKNVGTALSYYGLAWSIFSTIIAKGAEVEFDKNAVIDIGFNTRTPPPPQH